MSEKLDINRINNLLGGYTPYSDLPKETLLKLKKEHEDLFDSLPQKLAPENQSELEKATREDYKEICEALSSM